MVIKEPSKNIRKLQEYLNLSTDTVEISLEEQQSLEDIVLADDRERQKRNNAEALSMAIEKSSPLQKLTAFTKADYSQSDSDSYQAQLFEAIKDDDTQNKFASFTGANNKATPEQQMQLAHKWVTEYDAGARAETKTPIFENFSDVPTPSDDFEELDDANWRRVLATGFKDARDQPRAIGQRSGGGAVDTSGGSRGRPGTGGSSSGGMKNFHRRMIQEAGKTNNVFSRIPDGDEKAELNQLANELNPENIVDDDLKRMKQILDDHYTDEDYLDLKATSSSGGASTSDIEDEPEDEPEVSSDEPTVLYRGNMRNKHKQFLDHYANEKSPHSEEDVLAHMNEHGERNNRGGISSGKALDDWAKKFEADNDISGAASAFTRNGARKGWLKSASGTPPENAWGDVEAASGDTETEQEVGEEQTGAVQGPLDRAMNRGADQESDGDTPVNANVGDDKLDLPDKSYDIDSGKKDAIEYGLFDAETQEPTELGNSIFDNIQANMEEAEGIYNDNLTNMTGLQQRVTKPSARFPEGNIGEPKEWGGNVTGTALGHYLNNYNARNPENEINRTHAVDDDGNVTRNEGVEENTLGESPTDLSAHELAGAIGAGNAGGQSGVVQAHFLHEGGQDYDFLRGADVKAYSDARPTLPDIPEDEQSPYEDGVNTDAPSDSDSASSDTDSDATDLVPANREREEEPRRAEQEIITPQTEDEQSLEDQSREGMANDPANREGGGSPRSQTSIDGESGTPETPVEETPVGDDEDTIVNPNNEGASSAIPLGPTVESNENAEETQEDRFDQMRQEMRDADHYSDSDVNHMDNKDVYNDYRKWREGQRNNKGGSDEQGTKFPRDRAIERLAQLKHGKNPTDAQMQEVRDDHEFDDPSEIKAAIKAQRNSRDGQRNNQRSQTESREANVAKNIGQADLKAEIDAAEKMGVGDPDATEHAITMMSTAINNKDHMDAEHHEQFEIALKDLEKKGANLDEVLSHIKEVRSKGIAIGSEEHDAFRQDEHAKAEEKHAEDLKSHAATKEKINEHLDAAHNDPGFHPNRFSVHDAKTGERKSSHINSHDGEGKLIMNDHKHGDHPEHGDDWKKAGTHSHAPIHLDHTPEQREAYEKLHNAKAEMKSFNEYSLDDHLHAHDKEHTENTQRGSDRIARIQRAAKKANDDHLEATYESAVKMDTQLEIEKRTREKTHASELDKTQRDHSERIKPYKDRMDASQRSIDDQKAKHQAELDGLDADLQDKLGEQEATVQFPASAKVKQDLLDQHALRRANAESGHANQMDRMEPFHEENTRLHDEENTVHEAEKAAMDQSHAKDQATQEKAHKETRDKWGKEAKDKQNLIHSNAENTAKRIKDQHDGIAQEIDDKYDSKISGEDEHKFSDAHKEAKQAAKDADISDDHLNHDELGKSPASMEEEHGQCGPPEGETPPTDADGNPMVWRCGKGRNWVKKENFDAGASAAADGNVAFFPEDEHGGMTAGHGGNMFDVQGADSFQEKHGEGLGSEGVMSAGLHATFQQAQADGNATPHLDDSGKTTHHTVGMDYLKNAGIHLDKFGGGEQQAIKAKGTGQKIPKYSGARNWLNNIGKVAMGDSATAGKLDQAIIGRAAPKIGTALRAVRQSRERMTGEGYQAAKQSERKNDPNIKPSAVRELQRYNPFRGKDSDVSEDIKTENAAEKNATRQNLKRLHRERKEASSKRIKGGSSSSI